MKLNRVLLDEQSTDGGGGAVFGDAPTGGDGQAQATPAAGAAPTGGSAPASAAAASAATPAAQPTITPEAIAAAMKAAGVGQPATPAEPPRQYSQEDFDKAFQVFKVTPEAITALLAGGDGALKAFQNIQDGLVRQAVTMASYIVQDQLERYQKDFNPKFDQVNKYVSERQAAELKKDFFEEHKDLAQYEAILDVAVKQLKEEGATFATKADGFKAAAERTRLILSKIPGISLDANGSPAGAPANGSPNPTRMPTLSKGGQGGSAKSTPGSNGASRDASHAVFG